MDGAEATPAPTLLGEEERFASGDGWYANYTSRYYLRDVWVLASQDNSDTWGGAADVKGSLTYSSGTELTMEAGWTTP